MAHLRDMLRASLKLRCGGTIAASRVSMLRARDSGAEGEGAAVDEGARAGRAMYPRKEGQVDARMHVAARSVNTHIHGELRGDA